VSATSERAAARITARAVLAAAVVLLAGAAGGQPSGDARARTFASLPNWTGIWIAADGVMNELSISGRSPNPSDRARHLLNGGPYTTEWAARVNAIRNAPERANDKECGFPFPYMMESPWVLQFLITPEETAVIAGGREIRHIYTDGRAHPNADEIWATPWGDSVGHWEGDTLVVDTIAVQAGRFLPVLSESAHYTERIRMVSAERIEDELTMVDPSALAKPWTVTIPYEHVPGVDRMVHGDCHENDRNPVIDGKLTVTPDAH
jgi:hypothetical protein